jgi:hypothetical protein
MLCHWRYVLDNLFGKVQAASCLGATHIPKRVDENGKPYDADADDAAYATFQLEGGVIAHINSSWDVRVRRDDLVTFQVDGTHGSAVAGLSKCWTQHRVNTPRPVWNPDIPQTMNFFSQWEEVPDNIIYENGFKIQWEESRFREPAVPTVALPTKDRTLEPYATSEPIVFPSKEQTQSFNRIAYAAAHVVAGPLADIDPWESAAIDWEKTIAFRHYLWDLGLGVAEAMDTAQRAGGLGWTEARKLIRHALAAAEAKAGRQNLLRRGHRSSRPRGQSAHRPDHPRLREADRSD